MSGQIRQTANSIGYVELIYAVQNKLTYGKVKNAAGKFVKADLAIVTAAAAGAAKNHAGRLPRVDHQRPRRRRLSRSSSFTWLLIPSKIADAKKREDR